MTGAARGSALGVLRDERRFWIFGSGLLFVVAFLKGFTFPIRWAATQAQIDYSEGFTKRGFFGEFVTGPLHLEHYSRFAWFSTGLLLVFFGLVLLFMLRSGVATRFRVPVVVTVFSASFAVTYITHLSGYFDIPLAILTIPVLLIESTLVRFLIALPVTVVALLIHEIFLFVFLPLILLSFALEFRSATGSKRRSMALIALGVIPCVAVAMTLVLAWRPSLSSAAVAQLHGRIASRVDFVPYDLVFSILTTTAGANVHRMRFFLHDPWWQGQFWTGLLAFVPTLVFLFAETVLLLRSIRSDRRTEYTVYAAVCVLAPLLLNVIAWDICRWLALSVLVALLVICVLCRYLPGAPVAETPAMTRVGVLLIAVNMASTGVLIDGKQAIGFPFVTSGLHDAFDMRLAVPK